MIDVKSFRLTNSENAKEKTARGKEREREKYIKNFRERECFSASLSRTVSLEMCHDSSFTTLEFGNDVKMDF